MDIKTDLYLNKLGQGVVDMGTGCDCFSSFEENMQIEVLKRMAYFILQMGGVIQFVDTAIENSKLKPTYTPCQLLFKAKKDNPLGTSSLKVALSKIIALPKNERIKSLTLFVSLYRIAYLKKREKGFNPQSYWWHRDLSDSNVVNEILRTEKY